MLIVDRSLLNSAGSINGGVDRVINEGGVDYSFVEGGDGDVFTGQVTNMSELFSYSSFNGDIGSWVVSNVEDMTRMFVSAVNFDHDLSDWCVSSIGSKPFHFDHYANSNFRSNDALQPRWGQICL